MRRQDDSGCLEAALRHAMPRRPAPPGFSRRVMRVVRSGPRLQPPRGRWRRLIVPTFSTRARWTLASGVAAALLALTVPVWQSRPEPAGSALEGSERELAEVLHMAGLEWNRAQEAALSPIQENQNEF